MILVLCIVLFGCCAGCLLWWFEGTLPEEPYEYRRTGRGDD